MTGHPPNDTSSVPCTVDGCGRHPKAKGLCEMHYRRQLRTGDPHNARKPGPAPNTYRAQMRRMLRDCMSDRTFQRYLTAVRILGDVGRETGNEDLGKSAIRAATRPNGSLNVSKLERLAHFELFRYLDRTGQPQIGTGSVP